MPIQRPMVDAQRPAFIEFGVVHVILSRPWPSTPLQTPARNSSPAHARSTARSCPRPDPTSAPATAAIDTAAEPAAFFTVIVESSTAQAWVTLRPGLPAMSRPMRARASAADSTCAQSRGRSERARAAARASATPHMSACAVRLCVPRRSAGGWHDRALLYPSRASCHAAGRPPARSGPRAHVSHRTPDGRRPVAPRSAEASPLMQTGRCRC